MSNLPWKTHKKLLDAGGLGDTVYVIPARGGCKSAAERAVIERLLKEGRTVVYGRPVKPTRGITFTGAMLDLDILTSEQYERADTFLKEFLKGNNDGTENDM